MTHMHVTVSHKQNMTLKGAPAKITHINALLITFSYEKSGILL